MTKTFGLLATTPKNLSKILKKLSVVTIAAGVTKI